MPSSRSTQARAVLLVRVQDHFRIRRRSKAMTPGFEKRSHRLVVVDLTVERDPARSVFVRHRLATARSIDDRQTTMAERDARSIEESVAIGAAMSHRRVDPRHSRTHILADDAVKPEGTADPAHGSGHRLVIRVSVFADHAFEREALLDAFASRASQLCANSRLRRQLGQRLPPAVRDRAPAPAGRNVSSRISGVPPTRVATIGNPTAIASRIVNEMPSLIELFAKASQPASTSRTSSRWPKNRMQCRASRCCARSSNASLSAIADNQQDCRNDGERAMSPREEGRPDP